MPVLVGQVVPVLEYHGVNLYTFYIQGIGNGLGNDKTSLEWATHFSNCATRLELAEHQ